jgi:hypothetical protein
VGDTAKARVSPILTEDTAAVGRFLHDHMNSRFSAQQWQAALEQRWQAEPPNHGFKLEVNGDIVGALCALYSRQEIAGTTYEFCNPHSWCVLEPYRRSSVNLVLSLIKQPGYHFTMLSPNEDGEQIFAYLGFQPLPRTLDVALNLPTPRLNRQIRVQSSKGALFEQLPSAAKRCYLDHVRFPWLEFVAYQKARDTGFLIFKRGRFKRLPAARILYISDRALLSECWPAIRSHLLLRGLVFSRVESRLLAAPLPVTTAQLPASAKFYLSSQLEPGVIDYCYSELMVMDL